MGYLWLKSAHIIFVIAWMAGLLYLPRLYVYHAQVDVGSATSELFKVMEKRLLRYIATPAMLAVWATGIWLALWSGFYKSGWLHAKIALVLGLSVVHGFLAHRLKRFAEDRNVSNSKFYRILNEIPTLLLIGIVCLVVLKPF